VKPFTAKTDDSQELYMSIKGIVGLLLLVMGIVLLVFGISSSRSFGDQLSNFFTGRFTETTIWYLLGGIAAIVAGFVLVSRNFGSR
jgi:hypothetical protein